MLVNHGDDRITHGVGEGLGPALGGAGDPERQIAARVVDRQVVAFADAEEGFLHLVVDGDLQSRGRERGGGRLHGAAR